MNIDGIKLTKNYAYHVDLSKTEADKPYIFKDQEPRRRIGRRSETEIN